MRLVGKLGRFQLFWADASFKHPGLHLWTGHGHRQLWPLHRFGRGADA
jgi:hypothetical protein